MALMWNCIKWRGRESWREHPTTTIAIISLYIIALAFHHVHCSAPLPLLSPKVTALTFCFFTQPNAAVITQDYSLFSHLKAHQRPQTSLVSSSSPVTPQYYDQIGEFQGWWWTLWWRPYCEAWKCRGQILWGDKWTTAWNSPTRNHPRHHFDNMNGSQWVHSKRCPWDPVSKPCFKSPWK